MKWIFILLPFWLNAQVYEPGEHHPPDYLDRLAPQIGLTFAAGFLDGVGDKLQFKYQESVFRDWRNQRFYNPQISWKNKYKDWPNDQREKFPGSSTIFAFSTDAWHLSKTMSKTCYELSIVSYKPGNDKFWNKMLDVCVLKLSAAVGWHLADIVTSK